jgi:tRNA(Met) cytidine acetyltransferase
LTPNFSQIRDILSRKPDSARHRSILVLAGESHWQKGCLENILKDHENDSLWLGDDPLPSIPAIAVKQAHSWLGREKQVVIFDANSYFNADAFAAISGIVVGGGVFILLMPAIEQWDNVYLSFFGQRLVHSLTSTPEIVIVKQTDTAISFNVPDKTAAASNQCAEPFLTPEQQFVVEAIESEVRHKSFNPLVINSDRGRGKSAAIGIAAARLVESGIKTIAITAPRLLAAEVIFKHIQLLLPQAEVSNGKIKYKNRTVQFYPPDQLIAEDIKAEMLFVDEAAAIPVPLLTTLLNKYSFCVFSTTVHGYEGTGRGFAVRFHKVLNKQKAGWKKCLMKTPVRWAENDPLEKWMFRLLCLDAEVVSADEIGVVDHSQLEFTVLNRLQISKDESLLKEVFALLVLAHYRTQPSDLQRMLDDVQISIYTVRHKQHVIAVALVNHEGDFSHSLSKQVYRGERRPQGHLLAQALTYHCGVEDAATLNYARVMRIAVHPEYQQQGIGSKLLEFIIKHEKQSACDAVGTSFGMTPALLNFWNKSGFEVVRIGFRKEQTSGEHAAIMIIALSEKGEKVKREAQERFNGQLSFWFDDVLKDLPVEIKQRFPSEQVKPVILKELDKKDLNAFILYSRNYELSIAALNKLVLLKQAEIADEKFPDHYRKVLNLKIIDKADWKAIVTRLSLSGQAEARELFSQAINYLYNLK